MVFYTLKRIPHLTQNLFVLLLTIQTFTMNKLLTIIGCTMLIFSCTNPETAEESITPTVIGSSIGEDGQSTDLVAGDTALEQIWIDYIQAHNDRDLEKIAAINAEGWEGYPPNGNVIKGTEDHIEILDNWFKTGNPNWTVKWMITNSGLNEEGVMTHWLTTGNDLTDVDEEGNEILEHHVHDIEFAGDKIKKINVYARMKSAADSDSEEETAEE